MNGKKKSFKAIGSARGKKKETNANGLTRTSFVNATNLK